MSYRAVCPRQAARTGSSRAAVTACRRCDDRSTVQAPVIPELPTRITIREVGPRDGLQAEKPLPVEARARLISSLSRTGLRKIEAVSFVSPKAVPAMADAAEGWARGERGPDGRYPAPVPNSKGG